MTIYDEFGQLGYGQRRYGLVPPPKRRRVFFSFHYADIMRVNNVRNSREFATGVTLLGGDPGEFIDSSLWESKKLDGPDALKRLIREGMENSSAVCVLIGRETWQRRWVRYEIARSVIDLKGLLAVHINSIRHHQPPNLPDYLGRNPLDFVGLYRRPDGKVALCEFLQGQWVPYREHSLAVEPPRFMQSVLSAPINQVHPLSGATAVYDWIRNDGSRNLSTWVNHAVFLAGRN